MTSVFRYTSTDIAPNIVYTILFIVDCNERLTALSSSDKVPYKRIGKHFDLTNLNNTSSETIQRCKLAQFLRGGERN